MLGTTHGPLGAAVGITTIELLGLAGWHLPVGRTLAEVVALLVGAVAGLLPDIDSPGATAANPGRGAGKLARRGLGLRRGSGWAVLLALTAWLVDLPVRFISRRIAERLGHRGATHSWAAALFCALSVLLVALITSAAYWELALVAATGYLSHLLADGLTYGGQMLFWPLSRKKRWLTPVWMRISAKSPLANFAITIPSLLTIIYWLMPLTIR